MARKPWPVISVLVSYLGRVPTITAATPLEIAATDPAPWLQLVGEEFATRPWLADFTREWAAVSAADPDARMKALAKAAAETADGWWYCVYPDGSLAL